MSLEKASSDDAPLSFVVADEHGGQRLDAFLAAVLSEVSRVRVKRGINAGGAVVDGVPRKASYRISASETVQFALPPPPAAGPEPEPIELSILYEDESIAVVDKPWGMVVHPAKGHWAGTLASALVHHFQELSQYGGPSRPGIVHRLDRDTSGVIVVAKTDLAHERLANQFKNREVQKQYLAIVSGIPDRDRDSINHPIGAHPTQREKMALRSDHETSRSAETFYEVQERYTGFALLKAFPKTGRTHQIRLHLTSIGCPILCDKLYGGRSQITMTEFRQITRQKRLASDIADDTILLERQALHAQRLKLTHPITEKELEFSAELPEDMKRILDVLKESG